MGQLCCPPNNELPVLAPDVSHLCFAVKPRLTSIFGWCKCEGTQQSFLLLALTTYFHHKYFIGQLVRCSIRAPLKGMRYDQMTMAKTIH